MRSICGAKSRGLAEYSHNYKYIYVRVMIN